MGGMALAQAQHVHAGGDDRVRSDGVQILQVLRQPGDLIVAGQGVAGHMDPDPSGVGQLHRPGQAGTVEIAGEGPHAEGAARQVHRIRPIGQGHLQPLHVPGGSQQLRLNRRHWRTAPPWPGAQPGCG